MLFWDLGCRVCQIPESHDQVGDILACVFEELRRSAARGSDSEKWVRFQPHLTPKRERELLASIALHHHHLSHFPQVDADLMLANLSSWSKSLLWEYRHRKTIFHVARTSSRSGTPISLILTPVATTPQSISEPERFVGS